MNDERDKLEGERAKKELIAAVFARAASNYEHIKYFWPLGSLLVERLAISPGSSVLDVACGRGASLFPAAEAVGPSGRVVGIDISAPMAEQTEAEIGRRGIVNAHARQMDAEHLDFPDASFDYILCGFALAFFPRLEQALSEFARVLKPGGRLAVSTWGDDDPRWNWYGEMCKAYGIGVKMMTQSLDTPGEIQAALLGAGFTDIRISTEPYDMIYDSEEEWWMMRWSISGRATLEQMEPDVLARFKAEAFEHMQALKELDGFHDHLEAHFAVATKLSSSDP